MMLLEKLVINVSKIGALTSKAYAYQGRKWELETIESCDVFDPFLSSVRIEVSGIRIIRILPQITEGINEEWLDNRSRYCYDGLTKRRISMPFVRINKEQYLSVSWLVGVEIILPPFEEWRYKSVIHMGESTDGEAVAVSMMTRYLSGNQLMGSGYDWQSEYCVARNDRLNSLNLVVVLNVNLRREFPLLEYILKMLRVVGGWCEDKGAVRSLLLSNNSRSVLNFLNGRNKLCRLVSRLGKVGLIFRNDKVVSNLFDIVRDLSVWHLCISVDVGNKMCCELSREVCMDKLGIFYEVQGEGSDIGEVNYYIAQVGIGERSVKKCDQVFPSALFIEGEGLYLNMFGDIQLTRFIFAPGWNVRTDWKILNFIQRMFRARRPKVELSGLSSVRRRLFNLSPSIFRKNYNLELITLQKLYNTEDFYMDSVLMSELVTSYYRMNFVSRVSKILDLAGRKDKFSFYCKEG